jgi:enamine deaminase RidA (YjgF/YER057c/UK114 family)
MMKKQAIESSNPIDATKAGSTIFKKFGYSPAVRAGDFIYSAGQIGLNPDGSMPENDEGQIVNAFDRLKIVVEEAGASLDDIV